MGLAVVTGASSGFGRAAAEAFALRGFDLALSCRDRSRAADEVLTAHGSIGA
jgi:NAD(P)-dependent dehydrogenase (short-subunit alcohol dehydrogenase family)